MKSKKINGNWIMGAVLVVLLAVGTSGFAFRGGPGMGYGQAITGTATLTADQQEKIDAVITSYSIHYTKLYDLLGGYLLFQLFDLRLILGLNRIDFFLLISGLV